MNRVKTVQLGSIQIPESRYAFDSTAHFSYVEPMNIPADCYVVIEETTQTVNRITGLQTTESHQVSVLLPPTNNAVTGYDNVTDTVTLASNSGLDFALKYYPSANLKVSLCGGHYPQSIMTVPMPAPYPTATGPVLTTATVSSLPSDTEYVYVPDYLEKLNTTDSLNDVRHFLTGGYTSFVHADKPLPVELFSMLNVAMGDLRSEPDLSGTVVVATNAAPIVITTGASHGLVDQDQVTVTGVLGNLGANGQFLVEVLSPTTFELIGSAGTGAYTSGGTWVSIQSLRVNVSFGFDDQLNKVIVSGPTVVCKVGNNTITVTARLLNPPGGCFAGTIGFGGGSRLDPTAQTDLPPSIMRTVQMRPGNYSASDVAMITEDRMTPLAFFQVDPVGRTLEIILPSSMIFPVVIARGRYTVDQLVDYLNFYLNPPVSPANVTVSYNDVSGKFTFSHNVGLAFGLQFSGSMNVDTARALGFEAVDYFGSNTYISPNQAVFGVGPGVTFPTNVYSITTDPSQSRFTFTATDPIGFTSQAGTNSPGSEANWDITFRCDTSANGIAQNLQPGDIVRISNPFLSGVITLASFTTPIQITTIAAHGLVNTDNVSISCVTGNTAANGTFNITVVNLFNFTLDGSVGNAAYISGGIFTSNNIAGTPTNEYCAVVQSAWDATGGIGMPLGSTPATITLEPTASIFSVLNAGTVDEAVGEPSSANIVQIVSGSRNVFQLLFSHPSASASNFGFPSVAWPPAARALQITNLDCFPGYDPTCNCVPVATSYTAPFVWSMDPPPYILMLLHVPTGGRDTHTHVFRDDSINIFAKLHLHAPFLHISEEMMFYSFGSYEKIERIWVEFQNPNGTPVEFNGQAHTFSLLFTLYQGTADGICM